MPITPYCTSAQVAAEFKNLSITLTSTVNSTDVDRFIEESSAEIDVHLGNRYQIPITGDIALATVQKICIDFVAYRIDKILNIKKNVPIPDDRIDQELNTSAAYRAAKDLLKKLQDGWVILPDALQRRGDGGITSFTTNEDFCPTFKRDVAQW